MPYWTEQLDYVEVGEKKILFSDKDALDQYVTGLRDKITNLDAEVETLKLERDEWHRNFMELVVQEAIPSWSYAFTSESSFPEGDGE